MANAATIKIVISFFDKMLDVFGLVKENRIARNNKVDLALEKVHKALLETQAYIHSTQNGKRDASKEKELAWLWAEASIPLRHVDPKLAKICGMKRGIWSKGKSWKAITSGKANTSLSNVERLVNDLLEPRPFRRVDR